MSAEVKDFFKGEAEPESEFGHRMPHYPWLAILMAIKPGTGQEVIMSYQSCKTNISIMEHDGKIKKGEFRVATKGRGKDERVFIVRKGAKKDS